MSSNPALSVVACSPTAPDAIGREAAEAMAGILRALADPLRLRMVSAIAGDPRGESCVCDLTELADVSQPTVSHHLKVLREAGLVLAERRGTWVWYRIDPAHRAVISALFDGVALAASRLDEDSGTASAVYSATTPGTESEGAPASSRPSVLFVCVHNAGRSQMAAGYLRHFAGDRIEVRSAGSMPAEQLNPVAVEAMREEGIDIAAEQPKVLTTYAVASSDVVITMGCGDACPYFPGKRYEDWILDDPAGQGIDSVRPIRDEIRRRIEALIAEIL